MQPVGAVASVTGMGEMGTDGRFERGCCDAFPTRQTAHMPEKVARPLFNHGETSTEMAWASERVDWACSDSQPCVPCLESRDAVLAEGTPQMDSGATAACVAPWRVPRRSQRTLDVS